MRISDWSSDVCSSDLPDARDGLMSCADVPDIQQSGRSDLASIYRNIFGENLKASRAEKTELCKKLNIFGIGAETSNRVDNLLVYGEDDQIGRASGRERGCQYVEI